MAQAKVMSATSGAVGTEDVDVSQLGARARKKLMRAAILRYEGNQRQGTHKTKTRSEVARTGRKPYRQKGTGRARAGDFKSPIWRGGGTVFGPVPRSYRTRMPVKARREALRSGVLLRFEEEAVVMLRDWSPEKPSTKTAAAMLKELGIRSALIVLPSANDVVYRSFRNLPLVDVRLASDVNALDVLRRQHLVLMEDALSVLEQRLGAPIQKQEAGSNG